MKVLKGIKDGILKGDWEKVCSAYNRITGESLKPPTKVFDPQTAKKQELYDWLKKKRSLDPIKSYSLVELREIAVLFGMDDSSPETSLTTEVRQEILPTSEIIDDSNSVFVTDAAKLLPIDKRIIDSSLNDPSRSEFIESGTHKSFKKEPSRSQFEYANIQCSVCGEQAKVHPKRIIKTDSGVDTKCDRCAGKRRS